LTYYKIYYMSKTEVTKILSVQFSQYDADHNGLLDPMELQKLVNDTIKIRNPKRIVNSRELGIVLRTLDTNGDGMVSQQELVDMTYKFNLAL
jgi:Ca2+-binding EF-hand superfamily protein